MIFAYKLYYNNFWNIKKILIVQNFFDITLAF